ncbi:MAG: competence/damage-inducible protein A [Pseudomonadota bacterium]
MYTIALLATGDELTNGDILNTNGQTLAQQLSSQGFNVGQHCVVNDDETEIVTAIHYLIQHHDVIIMTGGLGPTSDDRTRFALANALGTELIFNEATFQHIQQRLAKFNLSTNKSREQQAFFPQGAQIIENPNGTACGCYIRQKQKHYFMLPGPPFECIPMFKQFVLPKLLKLQPKPNKIIRKWQLFGVPEGTMAAKLDKLFKSDQCMTGYRWHYPYLEFKLIYQAEFDATNLIKQVEKAIAPHIICAANTSASQMLCETLETFNGFIQIQDFATKGLLEYTLTHPNTTTKINFQEADSNADITVCLQGLNEVWQPDIKNQYTSLEIEIKSAQDSLTENIDIPFRSRQVVIYAIEYFSYQLRRFIEKAANSLIQK